MANVRWMVGLGAIALLVTSCAGGPTASQSTESTPAGQLVDADGSATAPSAPLGTVTPAEDQPLPGVAVSRAPNPTVPPSLISATTTLDRLPQVSAGRRDPFAVVAATPVLRAAPPSAQPVEGPPPPPVAMAPQPSALSVPQPPQLAPAPLAMQPLPAPVPVPAVSPTSVAEGIVISGVVQVGDRLSVIVEMPGEGTSRYASVGDRLANGRVLVKRIEMQPRQEPRVILEQNGVEIVRAVGDGTLAQAL